MPHAEVSRLQRGKAKQLRQTMTRAETLLWRYLKADHLNGITFRRQTPLGPYIVDFVSHVRRIVVEIDGSSHDFADRARHDRRRDAWLASRGYTVLRFTDDQVMRGLEGVLHIIDERARNASRRPPPYPSPARGEGTGIGKRPRKALTSNKRKPVSLSVES